MPSYLGDINYLERLGRPDSSPRRAAMKVNAIYGMMQAARAGIGIAMLPDYVTEGEDKLQRVLPGIELPAYEAYFVYPPALKNSKRVGVFRADSSEAHRVLLRTSRCRIFPTSRTALVARRRVPISSSARRGSGPASSGGVGLHGGRTCRCA